MQGWLDYNGGGVPELLLFIFLYINCTSIFSNTCNFYILWGKISFHASLWVSLNFPSHLNHKCIVLCLQPVVGFVTFVAWQHKIKEYLVKNVYLEIHILKWIKQSKANKDRAVIVNCYFSLFVSIFFAGNHLRFLDLWYNSLPSRFPGQGFLQELQSMRG